MDQPENALLTQLLLDVKQDVSVIKRDLAETKELTKENSVVLAEHARRSVASENRLDLQEEKMEKFISDMGPVQDHVEMVSTLTKAGWTAIKVLAAIASLVATILGLVKMK